MLNAAISIKNNRSNAGRFVFFKTSRVQFYTSDRNLKQFKLIFIKFQNALIPEPA